MGPLLVGLLVFLTVGVTACLRRPTTNPVPESPAGPSVSPIAGMNTRTPDVVTERALPPQMNASPVTPNASSFVYAMAMPVPQEKADADHIDEVQAALEQIKLLGINVVLQAFAPDSTPVDWTAYLDVATQERLGLVPWFREEPPVWNGSSFDMGINAVFLESMQQHPALYAFVLIDEPFHRKHGWTITSERLKLLYQQAKNIAPVVPLLVQFSREIEKAEARGRSRFSFSDGMCDICMISALEFRDYGEGNRFHKEALISNHRVSRSMITREDSDAAIWTTVQVFGSASGSSSYYMPAPDELQEMMDLLLSRELQAAGELKGIVWQQWAPFSEAQIEIQNDLSDPQFGVLRDVVKATATRLGLGAAE